MRRIHRWRWGAAAAGLVLAAGCTTATTALNNMPGASAADLAANSSGGAGAANGPWYPSLAAFEHYDSTRSHVFPTARFGGSFVGRNTVRATASTTSYPSGWNVTYLNAGSAFIYGGGEGQAAGSIGAYVAKVNPQTLKPIWRRQLIDTAQNGQWDYPGTVAILKDGDLYVVYGYHLAKLDPKTGAVLAILALPTGGATPGDTAYNGFDATPNGDLVAKSIYRQAGCTVQGGNALDKCPDPADVPSSVLSTIDPTTMTVIDSVTMPGLVIGRVTVGQYQGRSYAYFFTTTGFIRYLIDSSGTLTLDSTWTTGNLLATGQTAAWATVVMGDWVVTQCNGLPAAAPLTVYAVNQGNAADRFTAQPFLGDAIPPLIKRAYAKQGPGGTQAVSFIPATVSADPRTDIVYAMDALPGEIAALRLGPSGFTTMWKVHDTTTEFVALVGPPGKQAVVASDVPTGEIPGINKHDKVAWWNAATGKLLARSAKLPAITPATMVQPYYDGEILYPGEAGTLYRLDPIAR